MEARFAYEFIGFGAMEGRFAYEFIGFGAMEGRFAYEFIRFRAMEGRFAYEFIARQEMAVPTRAPSPTSPAVLREADDCLLLCVRFIA